MALTKWADLNLAAGQKVKQIEHAGTWVKGSGDNDWYALQADPVTGAIPVDVLTGTVASAITSGGVYAAKSISDVATSLAAVGGANLAGRTSLTIFNNAATTIYWGYDSSVTAATGTPIPTLTGVSFSIADSQNVYLIAAVAASDARITEAI